MSSERVVFTPFDDEELARIDALAEERGVSREEVIAELVRAGLALCEKEPLVIAREPPEEST